MIDGGGELIGVGNRLEADWGWSGQGGGRFSSQNRPASILNFQRFLNKFKPEAVFEVDTPGLKTTQAIDREKLRKKGGIRDQSNTECKLYVIRF